MILQVTAAVDDATGMATPISTGSMSAFATQLTQTARPTILFVWLRYAQTCVSRHWCLGESSVSWTNNSNREQVVPMTIHTLYRGCQEGCKMRIIGAYMKVKLAGCMTDRCCRRSFHHNHAGTSNSQMHLNSDD